MNTGYPDLSHENGLVDLGLIRSETLYTLCRKQHQIDELIVIATVADNVS